MLSEGTVSYLAAHVLGKVGGAALETAQWKEYQSELDDAIAEGGAPAWPTGCNQIDILKDKLFTNLPYMEGAFFYKDVAAAVGEDKLDQVLHDFYATHHGRAAGMQDMIDLIQQETGFDPTDLVESEAAQEVLTNGVRRAVRTAVTAEGLLLAHEVIGRDQLRRLLRRQRDRIEIGRAADVAGAVEDDLVQAVAARDAAAVAALGVRAVGHGGSVARSRPASPDSRSARRLPAAAIAALLPHTTADVRARVRPV